MRRSFSIRAVGFAMPRLALAVAGLCSRRRRRRQIFVPAGGGWQTYVNDRFGTQPRLSGRHLRAADAPPENGDGRRFRRRRCDAGSLCLAQHRRRDRGVAEAAADRRATATRT